MENTQNIKDLIQKFYPHAKEKLGFDHPVRVVMRQDAENAKDSLGKTAYYDPAEKLIVLYITDRHPKDVLRSFSHELVHHAQNCRGDLDDLSTDGHYAGDGKGREIEAEAYLLGNGFLVRDWEDGMKHKGVNKMKLTKSQLKGLIEQTVQNLISEKDADRDGSPAPPKWADPDDNDPKVKASLQKEEESVDEQEKQMDMNAIANVKEELRQLSDMTSSASRNLQRMGQEQFFRVLANKLEKAMEGQVASLGSSGELEEQEEVEEGTQPPEAEEKKPEDSKGDKTAKFLDDMIQKRLRKKKSIPKNPADLVQPVGPNLKETDELEEQEMKPTMKGKEIKIKKEKKTGKEADAVINVATDKRINQTNVAKPSQQKIDESNDTWYNSSLYESLKSKWTK